MELSIEKTGVTDVREGFDFLGYRVVQAEALRTGHWVGKLFIPKGKLNDLRHKIKVMVKGMPTGCLSPKSSATSIRSSWDGGLLPIRHKGMSGVQPPRSLDMAARGALAEKKARKSDVADAASPLHLSAPGQRRQWTEGTERLRFSVTEEPCITRTRALRNRTDGPQTGSTSNAKACAASGMRFNVSDISETHP